MHGACEPAVVPDAAGARHRVELGVLAAAVGRIQKRRCETGSLQRLLVGQRDLAVSLVALVESAAVFVGPLRGDLMWRVTGSGTQVHEPRLVGGGRPVVAQKADCAVGEVLGQVVALFRGGRRIDGPAVTDQARVPLVGHAVEESVEPVESSAQWPVTA